MSAPLPDRVVCRPCRRSFKDQRGLAIHTAKTHPRKHPAKRPLTPEEEPPAKDCDWAPFEELSADSEGEPRDRGADPDPPTVFLQSYLDKLLYCYRVCSALEPAPAPGNVTAV